MLRSTSASSMAASSTANVAAWPLPLLFLPTFGCSGSDRLSTTAQDLTASDSLITPPTTTGRYCTTRRRWPAMFRGTSMCANGSCATAAASSCCDASRLALSGMAASAASTASWAATKACPSVCPALATADATTGSALDEEEDALARPDMSSSSASGAGLPKRYLRPYSATKNAFHALSVMWMATTPPASSYTAYALALSPARGSASLSHATSDARVFSYVTLPSAMDPSPSQKPDTVLRTNEPHTYTT